MFPDIRLPRLAALACAMASTAFVAPVAAQDAPLAEGFTCCNLHFNGDWISDANWSVNPMIPAGARIRVLSYGRFRAFVEIDGKPMRLGQDYGRDQEPLERFTAKWVVPADPREKVATWPEPVREAIRLGQVIPGMTREQVIVSAGFPPTHKTPSLESPVWNYWTTRTRTYQVVWSDKGIVTHVQ